jgi:diguanylate cyclase (GGDEF)-like protein
MMMTIQRSSDMTAVNHAKKNFYTNLDFVLSTVAIAFSMRFILKIMDPALSEVVQIQPVPIYEVLRMPIDVLYNVTSFLQIPVDAVIDLVGGITGLYPNEDFPLTPAVSLGGWIQNVVNRLPEWARQGVDPHIFTEPPSTWMPGYFEWASVGAAVLYMFLRPVITDAYFTTGNWVLTQIIERQYVASKDTKFKEAIKAKNDEIRVAMNQSNTLKTEITHLNTSVVTDELTQAYNRRFFSEKIRETFNDQKTSRQHMTVLMVDIDHFKSVNDTYGHLIGDEVLVHVSRVLRELTPKHGFCCRYGGEEFSIILPQLSLEQAVSTAEIIRSEIIRLTFPSEPALNTTVSIGVATADFGSLDAQRDLHHYEDLIKQADDALYKAKTTGRNKVVQRRIG